MCARRLWFEVLEDRRLLANVHWNVDADGFWDVAANWIDESNVARVPGADDNVFLDRAAGPIAVTHRFGADSVKSLHASNSALVLSGGSLANTESSDLGAAFTLSDGVLIVNAPLATSGVATWSGGTIRGTGSLSNTGQWTLTGSTVKSLGSVFDTGFVFDNSGTIVHAGTGNLGIVSGHALNNRAGAVYDFQGDGSVTDAGETAAFRNMGILRKSAGDGTSRLALQNFTNDNGTIDVRTGTLANATSNGVSTGGTFTVAAGAVLDLAAAGSTPVDYVGIYTGSGEGAVRLSNGVLKVGAAGATFNFPDHLFQWTSGAIDGGLAGLTNAGFITIAGTEQKQLFGVLRNAGTIIHAGTGNLQASVNVSDPTRLHNLSGGVYDFQTDSALIRNVASDDTAFNNAGTLRKSGGSGTSSFNNVPFNNTGGVIDVRTGTLRLGATSSGHTGGTFQVAATAVLDLTSGTTPVFSGNYSGAGQGAIRLESGTLVVGAGGATFDFPDNLFQWSGGAIEGPGTLNNIGRWTLAGTAIKVLRGAFDNSGTIVHAGTGNLGIVSGHALNNRAGAVYDFQGDGSVTDAGETAAFRNMGILRKSAGDGTSRLALQNFTNDNGTIDVRTGTLANATSNGVSTGGTFTVAAGAVLDLAAAGSTPVDYVGIYTGSGEGAVRLSNGVLKVGARGRHVQFSRPPFPMTSGAIDGGLAGLTNAGFITIAGTEQKQLFGVLRNAGTIIHAGTGNLQASVNVSDPTRLHNLSGGVYDFQTDSALIRNVASDDTAFNNAGTLRKSGGSGTSSFNNVPFNNTGGVIDVRTGTLRLGATSSGHTGGTFQVAATAVLDLTSGTTPVFSGNYSGAGQGAIRLESGTLVVGAGGATFDFPDNLFQWTSGVIDGIAAPLTNRGSMTLDTITGFTVLRGTLQNAGRFLHLDGAILNVWGESGLGNFTNLAGGVYELQGDAVIQEAGAHGPGSAVHNFGTIHKSTGSESARIDTESFDNVGTVEVDAGSLLIQRLVAQAQGDSLTGGIWKVHNGGTLELTNSPRFTTSAATIVLDGSDARFPAIDSVTNHTGSLTIMGGRRQTAAIGRITRSFLTGISTGGIAFDPSTGNVLTLDSAGTAIREYTADGTEVLPRIPSPGGTSIQFDLDVASESLTVGGIPVPAGTLLVVRGTVPTLYAIDKNDGTILASVSLTIPPFGGGSYHAGRNSMFLVDSSMIYEVNPATGAELQRFPVQPTGTTPFFINTTGADVIIDPASGNLLIGTRSQGAIRELTVTGQFVRDRSFTGLGIGDITGMAVNPTTRRLWLCDTAGKIYEAEALFSNGGNVTLSAGSTLDVPGTFTQSASGTLTTQVGGNPASGQFGRLVVTNSAALAGTFGVELVDGFGPVVGQQFPIVTFPSATGSFSEFTGLDGGRLPLFTVNQLPQSVVLNAVGSAADLAFDGFVAATFPATAAPGQNISVTYDIRNLSGMPAVGDWYDSLYLSRDGSLDESDALLGRLEHRGGLAALSTYRETLTAPLPPLADASYRVIVLSDSRGLAPDANRANNVGFSSSTIAVSVPSLPLGTSVSGSISNGQDRYYRLTAPPGRDVKITAGFSTTGAAEMFVRYRELPDQTNFDQATSSGELQQRVLITNSQGGSHYVLVHGREGSGAGTPFTLLAEATGFEIVRITPSRGSNQFPASVEVVGSQFTPQTTLSLHRDTGESVIAEAVAYVDANHLRATFNLVGLPTGNYRLRAADAGRTVDALDTFTVTGEPLGTVSLTILAPAIVRVGASIGVSITIDNGSDSQAVAPILQIVATNVSGEQERFVNGEGFDELAGPLPPLFHGSVGVTFQPDPKADGVESKFQLVALNPTSTAIDWDGQKESLRPHSIPSDAWDAIWSNLRPVLGSTMADYYALLQNDARQLALTGVHTNSVDQLYHFELRKANDLPAVPVPAAAVDLGFPAPGLQLVFGRDFGSSIAQRFRVGRLGRGWVDNFDVSLSNDTAMGIVTIQMGHSRRLFAKNELGVYENLPGDFATLTESGGGFHLREKDGSVVAFGAGGTLDFIQDTNGNRITAGYTSSQLTSLTHSNGSALTLAYNGQGRISQVSDPAGRTATYVYDAAGQHLTSVTTTEGTTQYTYTSEASGPRAHAVTSIGFPTDTHLFFEYDSRGRLARQQRDGGTDLLTLTYNVVFYRVRDALDNLTDVYFDDSGQVKQTLDGLGRSTRVGHTGIFPTRLIAPNGTSSTAKFDERGNAVGRFDPLGQELQFDYESTFNNLTGWRDPLGHATSFGYDSSGNPQSISYPDGTIEQFAFDARGNLVRSVNRRGQLVSYTYDGNGLVTRKDLPDGTHVDYTYDAHANLLSAAGPTGGTTMEYDSSDRMTRITYPGGRFLEFTYDDGGRRTRATDQSGFAVNYGYDAAGRLAQLTDGSGQLLVNYVYDGAGRLTRETHGNGTSTTYDYDAANQLLHLVHLAPDATVSSRFDYTYDDNGRRTSTTTLDGTTQYVYDAAGRLIQATLPDGRVLTYSYDAAGNRTTSGDSGATTQYTLNDMNQYLAVGGTSQSFDPDGNLISSAGPNGPRSYSYNAEGQLTSVVTAQGTWTYEYDALGNRLASTHNGARTQYLIDPSGLGDVFGQYDGAGNLQSHYAHGLGLVSRIDAAGPAAYYEFDAVGNTAQLTGAAGTVVNSYSYLPFGEALQVSETISNPFTYVGQFGVMREGNGLDMRNRWYDPTQGRFTQQDPIGLAGGANLYAYVGNSPVAFVDPSGLTPINFWQIPMDPVERSFAESYRFAVDPARYAAGENVGGVNEAWAIDHYSTGPRGTPADYTRSLNPQEGFSLAEVRAEVAAARGRPGSPAGGPAVIVAAIAVTGSLASIGYGLGTIYLTGDLPECHFTGNVSRIFELCKSPAFPATLGDVAKTLQRNPQSFDPNDIVGPAGYGVDGYLRDTPTLPYTIHFENARAAGGPATEITVTHQLDTDLDLDAFQLGDFGFGDLVIDVPEGRQFYHTRIDLRQQPEAALTARQDLFVDVTAELDRGTRVITWKFTTLDPETLDLPINPFLGFLPPDRNSPEGQGFVSFSVRPYAESPSGTRIDAQASIVFDANAAIATNVFTNTLDIGTPTSSAQPLPTESPLSFPVSWIGNDEPAGSGIATYDVFASDNGGPFTLWLDDITVTSANYAGALGHQYSFYSVATDNVGHQQPTPAAAQSTTTVTLPTIAGTNGDDTIRVIRSGDELAIYLNTAIGGPPTYVVQLADISTLTLNTGDGNDVLTVNSGQEVALGLGRLLYNSGVGTNTLVLESGSARIESTAAASTLATTVQSGAQLTTSRLNQNGLTVNGNGRVNILAGGQTSVLTTLDLSATGTFDLADNDLVIQSTAAAKPALVSALYSRLESGYAGGLWNGTGITSSTAATDPNIDTGVALVDNAVLSLGQFGGLSVDENSVLLKYTYYGDIDVNGQVDADDLTVFANNFGRATGAAQIDGDIDFDGDVDAGDLTVFADNFGRGIGAPLGAGQVSGRVESSLAFPSLGTAKAGFVESPRDFQGADVSAMSKDLRPMLSRGMQGTQSSKKEDDELIGLLAESIAADKANDIAIIADARLAVGRRTTLDSYWTNESERIW